MREGPPTRAMASLTTTTATEPGEPSWSKVWDPTSNAFYYYDAVSGECLWDPPEGWKEDAAAGEAPPPKVGAATALQSLFRGRKAREEVAEVARLRKAAHEHGTDRITWVRGLGGAGAFVLGVQVQVS